MPSNPVNPFVPDFTLDLPTAWVWLVSALFSLLSLLPNPQSHTGSASPLSPSSAIVPPNISWKRCLSRARELCLFACNSARLTVNTSAICQRGIRADSDTVVVYFHLIYYVVCNDFIREICKANKSLEIRLYQMISCGVARIIPWSIDSHATCTLQTVHKS